MGTAEILTTIVKTIFKRWKVSGPGEAWIGSVKTVDARRTSAVFPDFNPVSGPMVELIIDVTDH